MLPPAALRPSARSLSLLSALLLTASLAPSVRCASSTPDGPPLKVEMVESHPVTRLDGEIRYQVTLEYRDQQGAENTITLLMDRVSYMRCQSAGDSLCAYKAVRGVDFRRCEGPGF